MPGNESTDPRIRAFGRKKQEEGGSGVMSYRPLNPAPMDKAVWVWGGPHGGSAPLPSEWLPQPAPTPPAPAPCWSLQL